MVKFVALALMIIGSLYTGWNIYLFSLGFFSYSEPKAELIEIETQDRKSEPEGKNLYKDIPEIGEQIGELTIPRLNKTFPIYQGTDEQTLRKGVGHFPKVPSQVKKIMPYYLAIGIPFLED